MCLLVPFLFLWVGNSDGRSVNDGVVSLYQVEGETGEEVAATDSSQIDHAVPTLEFPENRSKIQDRFDEEIASVEFDEEQRFSSVQKFKYEAADKNETERTQKNKTEQVKEKAMEKSKETEVDEIKKVQQIENEETEAVETEQNEEARKVESKKNKAMEQKEREMKEKEEKERTDIKNLEKIEKNAESKEEDVDKPEDQEPKKIEGKEIKTTEQESKKVQAKKEESAENLGNPAKSAKEVDENQYGKDATLESDEEKLSISEMKLLPIPSALRVSIMSVDYGEEAENGKKERADVEGKKVETAVFEETADMEARNMEASNGGSLDAMLPKVSVTVQEAFQEFVSSEPEAIFVSPQQAEEGIFKKDEIVLHYSAQGIDHDITIEDMQNTAEQRNTNSPTTDLPLKFNQSESFNVSLPYVLTESRETTESPTTTSMPITAQDPTTKITTTTTTTTKTTRSTKTKTTTHMATATTSTCAESTTTTIPPCSSSGCKHLLLTLTTSLEPSCSNLPHHLCSLLPPSPHPRPHLSSLLMANLAEDSIEHHLLSSCLADKHSTDLREVVRAVLVRLPWTDKSTLKEKSIISARAFPTLGLLARLEHVEVDGREVVKIVPALSPLSHQHYQRGERAKLLLEVATIIQTGEASGPGREEAEMAGCRLFPDSYHYISC